MPKGKTPSLIGGSNGRPDIVTAKKKCSCSRCEAIIQKDSKCADIPKLRKPFSSSKRFCLECLRAILVQSDNDIRSLEAQVNS